MSALAALLDEDPGDVHLFFMIDTPDFPVWYMHGSFGRMRPEDRTMRGPAWWAALLQIASRARNLTVDVSPYGGTVTSRQLLTEALQTELGARGSGRAEYVRSPEGRAAQSAAMTAAHARKRAERAAS